MTDSDDYRLYINTRFDSITTLMNAQFKTVHERLDGIHEQTTKTNGGLIDAKDDIHALELADKIHLLECPAMTKIDQIQTDLLEYKWFKQHPKLGIMIVAVCAALIMFNVFGIFEKSKVARDLLLYNKEQVFDYNKLIHVIDSVGDENKKMGDKIIKEGNNK